MSQGFELETLHVPQQSRRDKLRETPSSLQMGCSGLFPIYDPSLISSTLQTCAPTENPPLKEAAMNSMGIVGSGFFPSSSSSSSSSSQLLLDLPQSSIAVNQTFSQEDINSASNPLFYSSHIPQNPRDFDPSFDNGGGLVFKNHHHQPPQQPLSYAPHHDMLSTGQGLSLSLSSHYRNRSDSAVFDGKGAGYYAVRGVSGGNPMVRSSVPMGPFTGYAAILKGSKFLKPAQQLLEELCDVGRGFYMDKSCAEPLEEPEMESLSENSVVEDCPIGSSSGGERRRIKAKLISMLNEVYRRYKQYYQQLQAVIKSFESVAGLSTAAPFVSLAIKAMLKNFRCLKDAISNQLQSTSKVSEESLGKEENPNFRLVKVPHNLRILEQPHVWRPQRGLPERAVAVLRAWLFEHFLHPYPTDVDKQMLAKQTGLSRNQVSNWFINARVRLWKPMVEEMHVLDMREAEKVSEGKCINANGQCKPPIAPVLSMDKWPQNTTTLKNQDPPPSPCRNELPQLPNNCNGSVNFSYDSVVNHHGVGASLEGRNGGISLTLGLHQNNGAGLPKSLPLAVPHFVFEESNNSYLIGPFESQNRREIGGQLLHDFVG